MQYFNFSHSTFRSLPREEESELIEPNLYLKVWPPELGGTTAPHSEQLAPDLCV